MPLRQRKKSTANGARKGRQFHESEATTKTSSTAATGGTRRSSSWQSRLVFRLFIAIAISIAVLIVAVILSRRNNQISSSVPSQAPKRVQELNKASSSPTNTRFGSYELLETVPHDSEAFTQGLQMVGNVLYEGVGNYGKSELRRVDLATATVLQRQRLPGDFFGEGITYFEDNENSGRIVQLTWREKTAFVYDSETLKLLDRFSYNTTTGDGWGITWRPPRRRQQQPSTFIVSDGSPFLHTWESETYTETKRIEVYTLMQGRKGPIRGINELEYDPVSDTVLANVWFNDVILRIEPDTGFVRTIYNLRDLYPPDQRTSTDTEAVLNGISLVTGEPKQVWVTGKLWPHMFRIRLIEPDEVRPPKL